MEDHKGLGRINFEAYRVQLKGLTYDGKPIPEWDGLTDAVRAGWVAGARAVTLAGVEYAFALAYKRAKEDLAALFKSMARP